MSETERLEEITSAIKLLRKLAEMSRQSANSILGRYFPELREKWMKKARLRDKAALRLSKLVTRECLKIQKDYEPEQAYGTSHDFREHTRYGGTREDY